MAGHRGTDAAYSRKWATVSMLRLDHVEDLRARAHECALDHRDGAAELAELARGDVRSLQTAWTAFVPFLAHPVMAAPARAGMGQLDSAATVTARRQPAAA